jgi:monovalent cation/hydrogen antiporter
LLASDRMISADLVLQRAAARRLADRSDTSRSARRYRLELGPALPQRAFAHRPVWTRRYCESAADNPAGPDEDVRVDIALELVALATTVLTVTGLCRRFNLAPPLVLIAVGIVASYLSFVPEVQLPAEVVLVGLLPPLLYSSALNTSLVEFKANRRPILMLSVGLVVFTTLGIGVLVHLLLPTLPWWAAFATGAVVAPPDAVAASAIGRRIGLPRSIVTVLEGESLFNDATALVALRTALAATISVAAVGLDFLIAAGGGRAVGLAVTFVVARVRRRLTDPLLDSGLSFVTPFAAYLAAEEIHASGVIAVVVAGLLLGHKAPILQTAQSRITERTNWSSIAFLLESAVFLLIGLQARWIIADVLAGNLPFVQVLLTCAAVLVGVIVLRVVWVFATRVSFQRELTTPLSCTMIIAWAGMRGVVTLAAAFLIPEDTPHRDVLLLIAFTVTAGTLFLQGFSLPWLARRLRVPAPDPAADALARAELLNQASQAGLAALEALDEADPHNVSGQIRRRLEYREFVAWEQLGSGTDETPTETYARRRRLMIDAERGRVLTARNTGTVPHEVVVQVLTILDVEESTLDYSQRERDRLRGEHDPLLALEGDCDHLRLAPRDIAPQTPGQCPTCAALGIAWVHLRTCLTCGNVACCDSSPERHAHTHYEETGHPVMRSAEPGESWRWCFEDRLTG